MKLHCNRPALSSAFQIVSGVVPSRTPKEILKNVKLTAANGTVTLIGTDQEVGIRYEIPGVEIEQEGEALLPTNRMVSILRELQDETVDIEVTENSVNVKSGTSDFHLSSENPEEFPEVASFTGEKYYALVGKDLREAIRRTVFSTDVESTRYALGGVLFDFTDDSATLAATDTRRLAVVKIASQAVGGELSENTSPVIPRNAMMLLERSIDDDEQPVHIAVRPNDVLVKSGNSTIYSRLVEGRFPKYADVIPKETQANIDVLVGSFYRAVRQAQIVTDEESRGVDFHFGDGTVKLDSKAASVGESKIELPISYEGEMIEITFDPRFVAEFLRVLEPENQVTVGLNDGESAAVFRTDDGYTYVIMPLSRDR